MKRLLFLFTFIAASLFAWAQNNNTRVLIHETNGNVKGYLVERVDSIDFVKIAGPVSVEAKFLKYSAGVDGDTIWAAFQRSADCHGYRFSIVPKVLADKLENEMQYITMIERSNNPLFTEDFTNAQMTELPSGIDRSARAIEAHVNSHVDKTDRAIRSAVDSLVELTGNFGFASFGTHLYMNGMTQLFSQPEFVEGDHVQAIARLIDNIEPWLAEAAPNQPLNVFIGSENPIGKSSGATLIISKFRSQFSDDSYIGVIGPTRQNYRRTMELVRRTGAMLEGML